MQYWPKNVIIKKGSCDQICNQSPTSPAIYPLVRQVIDNLYKNFKTPLHIIYKSGYFYSA